MKTLILTCNTGQGHNSSAAAIKEVFTSKGIDCDIADTLSFFGKKASKIVDTCFTGIYRHIPKAFNFGYAHTNARVTADSVAKLLSTEAKRLYKYITENGYDNIVCVHIFPAIMIAEMRKKFETNIKVSLLATDYTCYPFMEKTDSDMYFLPHADLAKEFTERGIASEKLIPTGIPVKRAFLERRDRSDVREELSLPNEAKVVFVMGGSMGCGPINEMVISLAQKTDANTKILVSCGTNKKLLSLLEKHSFENLTYFSYTDKVPEIMAAADMFITKPGGISITEAGVMGLPMLLLNVVGGCETPNFNFFDEHGYAFCVESTEELADKCVELLNSRELLNEKSTLLKNTFFKDSAEEICQAHLRQ